MTTKIDSVYDAAHAAVAARQAPIVYGLSTGDKSYASTPHMTDYHVPERACKSCGVPFRSSVSSPRRPITGFQQLRSDLNLNVGTSEACVTVC